MNGTKSSTLLLALAGTLVGACAGEAPSTAEGTTGGEAASYQGAVASTDVALGQHEYEEHCSGCHPIGGEDGYGPAVSGIGWDPARMRQQIREGEDRMPAFGEDEISADELEALLAYLVTIESVVSASPTLP